VNFALRNECASDPTANDEWILELGDTVNSQTSKPSFEMQVLGQLQAKTNNACHFCYLLHPQKSRRGNKDTEN
jgi:hypothetical protein